MNKLAAFLVCAHSLIATSANAGPAATNNDQSTDMMVQFTGAMPGNIAGGLQFTDPRQVKKLALYLKQHKYTQCFLTGHASWAGSTAPFIMDLTAARIEVVVKALREDGVDTTGLLKKPRGGLDSDFIADGDFQMNRSVILECVPLVSQWVVRWPSLG